MVKISTLHEIASNLAEIANECCSRSDGYEENMRILIFNALKKVIALERLN